jgi:hypothetical protein
LLLYVYEDLLVCVMIVESRHKLMRIIVGLINLTGN